MIKKNVGIVGVGKIGTAIAKGLLRADLVQNKQILASAPRRETRDGIAGELGIRVTGDNKEVVRASDIVLITVKPQAIDSVLREISGAVTPTLLVVSVAAGVPLARIEALLPKGSRVVRVMTNTPSLIGMGASAYSGGSHASDEDLATVAAILESVGIALLLEERHLDAVTALSGSGPAYVFLFLESLVAGGVQMGLNRDVALQLALHTVSGSAAMARSSSKHLAELRDEVTSPGGTTTAGLCTLERARFRAAVMDAVREATERSRALGQGSK